jgi:hypothetical protein
VNGAARDEFHGPVICAAVRDGVPGPERVGGRDGDGGRGERGGIVCWDAGDVRGLDQANGKIPSSVARKGEVNVVLTVDGKTSNTVTINVQ